MPTLTALCCDEATVVLCSRLRKLGFEVSWLYMDELRHGRIEPEALNETNRLELYVFASERHRQAVLVARLDNLGKGASGAAVQNMRLMLGFAET